MMELDARMRFPEGTVIAMLLAAGVTAGQIQALDEERIYVREVASLGGYFDGDDVTVNNLAFLKWRYERGEFSKEGS